MKFYLGATDWRWYKYLSSRAPEDVNFWRLGERTAFSLMDVSWSGLLLSKFARLMKAADARLHWGGDWTTFKEMPHSEVLC